MAECRHRWQLRDVRAPFCCLIVCDQCHAIMRASVALGVGQSRIGLEVLSYGHLGVGLEDVRAAGQWLGRQLQLGQLQRSAGAPARVVRHKRKKKAA